MEIANVKGVIFIVVRLLFYKRFGIWLFWFVVIYRVCLVIVWVN